jgi:hypothetical protein
LEDPQVPLLARARLKIGLHAVKSVPNGTRAAKEADRLRTNPTDRDRWPTDARALLKRYIREVRELYL